MNPINKLEALKLLKFGDILIQKRYPDFGTKSLFRPIKRYNKFTSKFFIGDKMVNHKSGYSIIESHVKVIKKQRHGLTEVIEWTLK